MDAGRVLQIGTPSDLYERPASLFVADFIGTNNFVQGTVVDVRDGIASVQTPAGVMRGAGMGALAAGAAAVATVRPQHLVLDDGAGTDVTLRGRVVIAQYLGSLVRYEVEVGGGVTLRVDVSDPRRHGVLAPGRDVAVSFRATSAQVFPSEASA
jgi:iron(III) transport system ATP-binding protein